MKTDAPSDPLTSYEEVRAGVVGQTFETLTLGSRKFTKAEVSRITDTVIVIRHAGGVDEVPWSEVPDQVRKQWGYNPSALLTVGTPKAPVLPGKEKVGVAKANTPKAEIKPEEPRSKPEENLPEPSSVDAAERAREIARRQSMLNAQMVGIRSLESDLTRHASVLAQLRNELQTVRTRLSGGGSGGIRVERVNGESTRVDRAAEARALESKIKAEEPLVAQLSKALEGARREYEKLQKETDQLRSE